MRLKWYGHASFLVTSENGTTVITDPYTPETSGYLPIPDNTKPNIPTIIATNNKLTHPRTIT